MKIKYEEWVGPRKSSLRLAEDCAAIARRYQDQGYDLSVRQVFYQLVAAGSIPNTVQSYKTVAFIIDKARMAGMIDWYSIVDRTRGLRGNQHWDTPDQIVDAAARGFRVDKWRDCDRRVEVWVEKEALSGVVGRAAEREDVDWFACRGYSSSSAMWLSARRFLRYWEAGQAVTILHLGDHDPSGIDMTRDIRERLELFLSVDWVRDNAHRFRETDPLFARYEEILPDLEQHVGTEPLRINRIALNMDQVRQYTPPPNPAKTTDSRYASYRNEHGDESWELDALNPTVLADMIRDEIRALRDDDAFEARADYEREERALLERLTGRWSEVSRFLAELDDEE